MTDQLSKKAFSRDLRQVRELPEAGRWNFQDGSDLEVLVTMFPANAPDQLFDLRLVWDIYPDNPPSLKFRDRETGRLDNPHAWPQLPGYRPTSLDACVNYCREGFVTHPEWVNDPNLRWKPEGNVLLFVLRTVQAELDLNFGDRHP